MSSPLRVLIHGGGIGGLTLATALARRGHQVDVAELRDELDALGVGIIQPSNALHVMREIGVLEECLAAGFEWEVLTICDPAGAATLAKIPQPRMADAPSNNGIPRPALAKVLGRAAAEAGAKIRFGTTITELADDGEGVDVTLSDGSSGRWDLVVGFDGIGSPLRKRLYGDRFEPEYTGFANWRVTVPRDPEVRGVVMSAGNLNAKALLTPITDDTMYLGTVFAEAEDFRPDPEHAHEQLAERLASFSRPGGRRPGPRHRPGRGGVLADLPGHRRGRLVRRPGGAGLRRRARQHAAPRPGRRDGRGGRPGAGREPGRGTGRGRGAGRLGGPPPPARDVGAEPVPGDPQAGDRHRHHARGGRAAEGRHSGRGAFPRTSVLIPSYVRPVRRN